jgi:endoglucanase
MSRVVLTVGALFLAASSLSQYNEPSGGLYPTNLVIFDDQVRKGFATQMWGVDASLDNSLKRNGSTSWQWNVNTNSGMHIMWGGWGQDTTVFWVHDQSHLSFWARPSNDRIQIYVQLGFMDGQYDVIPTREIGAEREWRFYDVIVPSSALRRPLNNVKIMFSGTTGTVHFDDMKISNVRLYAGRGESQSLKGVFADQIGYDTYGIKTFSSEKYNSYQIVRVADKKVMHTGTDRRLVISRAVGDYAVYVGDFTKFETPGRYIVKLDNGATSYPFEIGPNVYDATLRAAIRFFYYQRNNSAITMPFAEGPWVHEKDEKELVLLPRSMGGTKRVRKGWHDAGDLAIYMPNHTYASFWLAAAWDDFRFDSDKLNIPESGNGVPDLLDELRWGLDWILDMQDRDGGFFQNMCVLKNSPYAYGKTTPLTITGYELTNKTTPATAAASAILAYASTIFSDAKLDPGYANRMRAAAVKGWKWLERTPQQVFVTENCNTYQDDSDIHARVFAAAALFLVTGDEQYHRYFLSKDPGSQWISDYNNQTNLAYLLYLKSQQGDSRKQAELRNLLVGRAKEANAEREKHPFGFVGYYYWGSLGTSFARVGNYNLFDWKLNSNLNSLYTAQQQLHYTFGQNSLNFVYLSGFGTNGMKEAFHHWLKTLDTTPHNFPGLLPGGPNENPDPNDRSYPPKVYGYWGDSRNPRDAATFVDQRYTDNDSWSTNEIAVNQSAQLVYVLSAAHAYAKGRK